MLRSRNGELRLIASSLEKLGRDFDGMRSDTREGFQRVHDRIDDLAVHGLPGRVDKLESNWTWLFRGVVMALLVGAIGLLFVTRSGAGVW